MKKFLILFVVLSSAMLLAQTPNWTSVKETNINVGSASSVVIFTNRDGNHVIVQESNILKYYKMNLNGVAGSSITIESSSVVSPSISGDADNIYIVYGIGSQLRVKRSINGGSNWSTIYTLNLTTNASRMESVVSNGNLHVTYLESNIVKYRYRNQAGSWSSEKIVSTGETGTNPRINARYEDSNHDYVYFLWEKQGTNIADWRRYEVSSNSWNSVRLGYSLNVPNLVSSDPAGFIVTASNIIIYNSYYAYDEFGTYLHYFGWWWRDIATNNYLGQSYPDVNWLMYKLFSTTTFDNINQTVYYYTQYAKDIPIAAIWRSKSENGYWDDVVYEYSSIPHNLDYLNLSSAGNEVHVIWKDEFGNNNGNNLRYRWDNQNPIAPQNLTLINNSGHPRLQWPKNPEPDIYEYMIYRDLSNGLGFQYLASTSNTQYDDPTVTINPPGGPAGHEVYYKITAADITNHESGYSDVVSCNVPGNDPYKSVSGESPLSNFDYKLSQNYPNPFNPSTLITYQLKEKGFVSLKMYNMLGKEVAVLVKENQDKGAYSVNFNGSNLPSGVYIYSLRVNDFVQNNKMTLMK